MIHDLTALLLAGFSLALIAAAFGFLVCAAGGMGDRIADRALREDREVAALDDIWELSA